MISDYNEVAWVPGQYAKQATTGAKTWYPGKVLFVEPMKKEVSRQFRKNADKALHYAPLISIVVTGMAFLYVVYKDMR